MENLVVTLETAKKLRAAGYLQACPYVWLDNTDTEGGVTRSLWRTHDARNLSDVIKFAAPTAQEIADHLPRELLSVWKSDGKWAASHDFTHSRAADTMAEALALLWPKLQEAK